MRAGERLRHHPRVDPRDPVRPDLPRPERARLISSATAVSAYGAGARSSQTIPTRRSSTSFRASREDRPGWRTRSARARAATAGGATPRPWTGSRSVSGGSFAPIARRSAPASSASTERSPSAAASDGRDPTSPVSCGGSREPSEGATTGERSALSSSPRVDLGLSGSLLGHTSQPPQRFQVANGHERLGQRAGQSLRVALRKGLSRIVSHVPSPWRVRESSARATTTGRMRTSSTNRLASCDSITVVVSRMPSGPSPWGDETASPCRPVTVHSAGLAARALGPWPAPRGAAEQVPVAGDQAIAEAQ
jgi:hypothetical protein